MTPYQSRRLNDGLPFAGLVQRAGVTAFAGPPNPADSPSTKLCATDGAVGGVAGRLRPCDFPGAPASGVFVIATPARAALTTSSVGPVQGIVIRGGSGKSLLLSSIDHIVNCCCVPASSFNAIRLSSDLLSELSTGRMPNVETPLSKAKV